MSEQTSPVPLAVVVGAGTFAWYAMPGAVTSRGLRALLKTGLAVGITAAYAACRPRHEAVNGPDRVDELFNAANTNPGKAVAVGAVALGAGVGATVWGEKAMFRWGQRRRAAGRRWPFGLPALIMGALAIVGNLAEPPKA